ncbi:MAG: HPr kinase/phosphatase C-terminal domain-containing protein [Hyphomicrobium sp.]|nr:HPr kinase/phosphatase C-terminal domain-containing protein [Hyphomicrobium sp.]
MAAAATEIVVHGTAIALGGRAALLRGASGSGKSDLALRALAAPVGSLVEASFGLVADDQVVIRATEEGLTVSPPDRLQGLIEVRGLGIVTVPHRSDACLSLLVDLVGPDRLERLPDPWPTDVLLGVSLPVLRLAPFNASAPLKLALALTREPWRGPSA